MPPPSNQILIASYTPMRVDFGEEEHVDGDVVTAVLEEAEGVADLVETTDLRSGRQRRAIMTP
jgi:hypothetical protein